MAAGSSRAIRRLQGGASMFDMSVKWPHGARVAVTLTFDFDAETSASWRETPRMPSARARSAGHL